MREFISSCIEKIMFHFDRQQKVQDSEQQKADLLK
jgi:hypothetical protein